MELDGIVNVGRDGRHPNLGVSGKPGTPMALWVAELSVDTPPPMRAGRHVSLSFSKSSSDPLSTSASPK